MQPAHPRFVRLKEKHRKPLSLRIDHEEVEVLEGDMLLTALMLHRGFVRIFDFTHSKRSGFCMMGACQDCWAWTADGDRIRTCTTQVAEGMNIFTQSPEATWPTLR